MKHETREQLISTLLERAAELRLVKGNDYSGMEDVNLNFKRGAARVGLDAKTVTMIYLMKHMDAIETFVRDGKVKSEPIEGRIVDAVNYLLILASIIEEEKETEKRIIYD